MKEELFLDTDVFAGYLLHSGVHPPLLERLASTAMLFTSVVNAAELLAAVRGDKERFLVESVLGGIHVLGFHQRYARRFGALADGRTDARYLRDCMVAGCCLEARMPLVTGIPKRYRDFQHLTILDASELNRTQGWQDIAEMLASSAGTGEADPGR